VNGADLINMLNWTRGRLLQLLDALPEEFLDYKPPFQIPKTERYNRPRMILSHIASVESYWIHEKIIKDSFETSTWSFPDKSKQVIMEVLNIVRNKTLAWLSENIERDMDVTYTPRAQKTFSWLFYHVAEHEAHHLGQIAMLTTFAGVKTPWV
jgi:uncharacterized damage-inducible protein DinB